MDLYKKLGIDKTATHQKVCQVYTERIHPYLVSGTYEQTQECLDIIMAYEILGDPRSRSLYDRYGHFGAILRNTYFGRFIEPSVLSTSLKVLCLRSLVFILMMLQLTWLGQKIDGSWECSYWTIFSPLYFIFASLILILIFMICFARCGKMESLGYLAFISPWLGDDSRNPSVTQFLKWHYGKLIQVVLLKACLIIINIRLERVMNIPASAAFVPLAGMLYQKRDFPAILQLCLIGLRIDTQLIAGVSWPIIFIPTFVCLGFDLIFNVVIYIVYIFTVLHETMYLISNHSSLRFQCEALEMILLRLTYIPISATFMILISLKLEGKLPHIFFSTVILPLQLLLGLGLFHSSIVLPAFILVHYFPIAFKQWASQIQSYSTQLAHSDNHCNVLSQTHLNSCENTPLMPTEAIPVYGEI
ncbi:hypothetical protein DSO57_1008643 [Entomophthora muscae]|uniref:Uncharacterized protein n=1 Tax=Entomophthora muscae TaxID=34485 RepID=A0ACC2SK08_9FUNG|nr:hypothetical protein DSO57_1008643 [Entomophthora muscae]